MPGPRKNQRKHLAEARKKACRASKSLASFSGEEIEANATVLDPEPPPDSCGEGPRKMSTSIKYQGSTSLMQMPKSFKARTKQSWTPAAHIYLLNGSDRIVTLDFFYVEVDMTTTSAPPWGCGPNIGKSRCAPKYLFEAGEDTLYSILKAKGWLFASRAVQGPDGKETVLPKQDSAIKVFDKPVKPNTLASIKSNLESIIDSRYAAYMAALKAGANPMNLDWTVTDKRPEFRIHIAEKTTFLNDIMPTQDILDLALNLESFRLALGINDASWITSPTEIKKMPKADHALFKAPKTLRGVYRQAKDSEAAAAASIKAVVRPITDSL